LRWGFDASRQALSFQIGGERVQPRRDVFWLPWPTQQNAHATINGGNTFAVGVTAVGKYSIVCDAHGPCHSVEVVRVALGDEVDPEFGEIEFAPGSHE
jgi:hypothetical protein